jgi:hypothetical protein
MQQADKVIGYFSYTNSGEVTCDGDACVIAGSEELMKTYINKKSGGGSNSDNNKDIIKKTRFGEIINGMNKGGAYAFDKEAFARFLPIAKLNKLHGLPDDCSVPSGQEQPQDGMYFIRIQLTGF